MSTQFKLDQTSKPEQNKKIIDQHLNKRPNIDHLLKKISLERKEEKKKQYFYVGPWNYSNWACFCCYRLKFKKNHNITGLFND